MLVGGCRAHLWVKCWPKHMWSASWALVLGCLEVGTGVSGSLGMKDGFLDGVINIAVHELFVKDVEGASDRFDQCLLGTVGAEGYAQGVEQEGVFVW